MLTHRHIWMLVAAALATAGCGKSGDLVATAQTSIFKALESQGIYERDNLPEDNPPTPDKIKGWFDVIGGAYRHIVNEAGTNRGPADRYEIARGDSIALTFDARIFTGSNFESYRTFFTNDPQRIRALFGSNPDFAGWSTEQLRIKVGDDARILKSLQEALIGCRAGDGDPTNDNLPGGVASDEVRVYITPDLAFGNDTVYDVPRNSTVVWAVTQMVRINN